MFSAFTGLFLYSACNNGLDKVAASSRFVQVMVVQYEVKLGKQALGWGWGFWWGWGILGKVWEWVYY